MTTLEIEVTTEALEQDKFQSFKQNAAATLSSLMGEYRSVMLDADRKVVTIGGFLGKCRDQFKVQGLKAVFMDWAVAQSGQGKSWVYRAIAVAEVHATLPAEFQDLPSEDLYAVAKVPNPKDRAKVLSKGQTAKGQALTAVERTKLIRDEAAKVVAVSDPDTIAEREAKAADRERAKTEKETVEARKLIEAEVFAILNRAGEGWKGVGKVFREGILIGVNQGQAGLLAFDSIVDAFGNGQREPIIEESSGS